MMSTERKNIGSAGADFWKEENQRRVPFKPDDELSDGAGAEYVRIAGIIIHL